MPRLTPLLALTTFLLAAAALQAQQPTIVHAQLTTEPVGTSLATRLDELRHSSTPVWVGYSIPVAPGFDKSNESDQTSFLEGDHESHTYRNDDSHPGQSIDHETVLLRLANNAIEKVRLERPARTLDAGNQRFVWLTGVSETDSIHTFAALAHEPAMEGIASTAIFIIAVHRSPEATISLIGLAAPASPLAIREKAAFWLANQRGKEGFEAIQRLAREDADPKFRQKLTFDLTLTREPGGLDEIIRMAHSDSSPEVRKQAQFWMAVKGGKKVSGDLRNLAENDPDDQIRKSAVFALSRLPSEEAATQLIQVASSSKDPAVRKQAVFWLGESKDPRALDYLTALLRQ
ncbi:HEAT repeat domain-containing protein [Granulicella sibirica]|uniref:PBS lyase HEAT domain protein repeat-containing protein n=1 Tax=Granulicella sibirica TaxID=2479048 RepID=A0A4Q0SZX5_9BACT|nr:HEAT repeat domain-containing protein [Granulicella sibirica]RXH56467.1 PBS lyase HEAT domain protein repeat-containing protein [Granulicella sibirica]